MEVNLLAKCLVYGEQSISVSNNTSSYRTASPLHMNLQVTIKDVSVFACLLSHTSSHVWHTWSYACILHRWLCFCVPYCTELYRVQ